jgi:hypothetical protein
MNIGPTCVENAEKIWGITGLVSLPMIMLLPKYNGGEPKITPQTWTKIILETQTNPLKVRFTYSCDSVGTRFSLLGLTLIGNRITPTVHSRWTRDFHIYSFNGFCVYTTSHIPIADVVSQLKKEYVIVLKGKTIQNLYGGEIKDIKIDRIELKLA